MKARGAWDGMFAIARFNWPFYAAAIAVLIASSVSFCLADGFPLKVISAVAALAAAWFFFGSLGVSHFIYDRSDLYRWGWLQRALSGAEIYRAIFCHCGFDETSEALRKLLGKVQWHVLDHFEAEQMTEPSIRRARARFPPSHDTLRARYDSWPVGSDSVDVVFGLLAIHELRADRERIAWFAECRRCLHKGGRVVVTEHVRDVSNFLAFGPGSLHFHSPARWRRCWESAGLRFIDEFRVTRFVRVFVLSAP